MTHLLAWVPVWHQLTWLWGGEGQGGASGTGYLITSGPLGDLFVLGGAVAIVRQLNCHVHGCLRPAWHKHPEHGHPVCKRHHPGHPLGDAEYVVEDEGVESPPVDS